MSKQKESWNTKENAKVYDIYARSFPLYKETSKDLIDIAGILPGITVVDLAAGTGATTQAILNASGGDINIIAVDQAEEMLNKVKEKFFGNDRVKYIVAQAEDIDTVISYPVDAIVCNSAFWQMVPQKTLEAVSHTLKDGGIFVFNLPDNFFAYEGFKKNARRPLPYDFNDIIAWGEEVSLHLIRHTIKEYDKSIEEVIAFNKIPVMKKNFLSEKEREDFIKRITSSTENMRGEWVYFVFKKREITITR